MSPKLAILTLHHPLLLRGGAQQAAYSLFVHLRKMGVDCLFVAADPVRPGSGSKANTYIRRSGMGSSEYLFSAMDYDFFWHRSRNAHSKKALIEFLCNSRITHLYLSHFMYFGIDLVDLIGKLGIKIFVGFHEMLASCFADGQMVTKNTGELCTRSAPERCVQCFPMISTDLFYLRNLHFKICLDQAAGYIVPSIFLKDRLVAWGLEPGKFEVIWHGIDETDFDAAQMIPAEPPPVAHAGSAKKTRSTRSQVVRFGYFGQLVDNKGLLTLFAAAALLEERGVGRFEIQINGANLEFASERFRASYRRAIEQGGNWSWGTIIEKGPYLHETLPTRMLGIDAVVVPSTWWEVYCMVIDEAKFFGKPVIASAIGGIPERVEHGKDGYLFPSGDAVQLAAAMERVLLGQTKFSAGTLAEHAWPATAKRYLDVLFRDANIAGSA